MYGERRAHTDRCARRVGVEDVNQRHSPIHATAAAAYAGSESTKQREPGRGNEQHVRTEPDRQPDVGAYRACYDAKAERVRHMSPA